MKNTSFLTIGHTTTNSSKIWFRFGDEVSFVGSILMILEVYNENKLFETQQYTLESKDSFGTKVFELFGLSPNTYYSLILKVYDNDDELEIIEGQFKTFSINNKYFSFFLSACYLSRGRDKHNKEYEQLRHLSNNINPAFMLNIGDQIYIDTYRRKGRIYSVENYIQRYIETWSHKNTKNFRSHLPQYMIWDDHEIYNNFYHMDPNISFSDPKENKEYQEELNASNDCFENASVVYEAFQHQINPHTDKGIYYYNFDCSFATFFVMDTRGERTKDEIITDSQLMYLEKWMIDPINKDKVKCIVSSVPFVLQTVDFEDKWSSKLYSLKRDEILKSILRNDVSKVVFLTGDVHNACHASFECTFDGVTKTFHEFTAGPISQMQIRAAKEFGDGKHKLPSKPELDIQYELFEHMAIKGNKKKNRFKTNHNVVTFEMYPNKLVYRVFNLRKHGKVIFEGCIELV